MGVNDYPIGTLGIMVNLRQLLDGYESIETRRRQRGDGFASFGRDLEAEFGEDSPYNISLNINDRRSRIHQHGQGDNVAGDRVQGDKIDRSQ